MGPSGFSVDDRDFRSYVTGACAVELREEIREKLLGITPDFTDDVLVDYVVVLLRNGRGKDEAMKELDVFLGENTVHFVSWLWDHLSSILHMYREQKASFAHSKSKSIVNRHGEEHDSEVTDVNAGNCIDVEYEKQGLTKQVGRNRHNRDWRELVQEDVQPVLFQSSKYENHLEGKTQQKTGHAGLSRSYKPRRCNKRSWEDERQPKKRGSTTSRVGPPCRILQCALLDAVRTTQQNISRTEPVPKRLRSLIYTSPSNHSFEDCPQMIIPVEDTIPTHQLSNINPLEEREYNDLYQNLGANDMEYYQSNEYNEEVVKNTSMLDYDTDISFGSDSDQVECGDFGNLMHQADRYSTRDQKSMVSECSVFHDADGRKHNRLDQDLAAKSRKIVNISVNVNTWKPQNDGALRNLAGMKSTPAGVRGDVIQGKSNLQRRDTIVPANDEAAHTNVQKVVQKTVSSTPGSYSASAPDDDVNSRILFVSNVHFVATKDTLSRHFNKFGEVVKVIIMKNVATGQPNGSAFIEFLQKESAEQALALNGTSFMSRVLKVVRRPVARHEAAPMTATPPLLPSIPPFPKIPASISVPRSAVFSRARFPTSMFPPFPVQPGARSLQWKRGAPSAQPSESAVTHQSVSQPARSYTYVRGQSKPDSSAGGKISS